MLNLPQKIKQGVAGICDNACASTAVAVSYNKIHHHTLMHSINQHI